MRGSVSLLGLTLGAIGFLAALTPGMIPRPWHLQGLIAGIAFGALYGLGVIFAALWGWLGLAVPCGMVRRRLSIGVSIVGLLLVSLGLFRVTAWQNSVREMMALPSVETGHPIWVAMVGASVAALLIVLGKAFHAIGRLVAARLRPMMPTRIATLFGLAVAATLLVTLANGVLLRSLIQTMDSAYQRLDALLPSDLAAPIDGTKTGGPASLIRWQSLGSEGRNRVLSYPSRTEIEVVTGQAAKEPLRVYVGLNSADSAEARAALALAEMKRIGAFDRALLIIATPTGTGWVDPASMATVEMLHHGDVASVSVQYSYLPSWLSLFVEPEFGLETARTVFRAVYSHWRELPKDRRPRLYLSGLSLGSLNSDLAADLFDIIGDPHDGAFWVGAPFASRTWQQVMRERKPGTPVWAPEFRDGSLIRVLTGKGAREASAESWGAMRIVYLNYPSDPIVYFETTSLWRKPRWMQEPRSPDISAKIRWIPVVSFLQHGLDMMIATQAPVGFGHVYAATHYLDGWLATTAPKDWDISRLERLRAELKRRGL
ncbi:MAG: alpha/beta-hydrolase family protein [Rhizobiales bacterium]|nr:alpha/beta-hydrolase family protein [Hyphomicrobiales bacterium]